GRFGPDARVDLLRHESDERLSRTRLGVLARREDGELAAVARHGEKRQDLAFEARADLVVAERLGERDRADAPTLLEVRLHAAEGDVLAEDAATARDRRVLARAIRRDDADLIDLLA